MASQRTVKAILLDGMGTLIRLVPPAPALAAELGVDEETAEHAFRAEAAYYVAHHLEGRDSAGLDALRDRCAAIVAEVAGTDRASARRALLASLRFEAFEDAAPALTELRERGVRLVVVSNWDYTLPGVLARVGLASLLDDILPSAAVGAAKPDRKIFEAALKAANCEPQDALHVGDSEENDLAGAKAAGITAVLLARAPANCQLPTANSVIHSLSELPPLLS